MFWLFIVTIIAIVIRSWPAWTSGAWGCDFGIYYGLTNSFVENKALFSSYTGWGNSYQYFPVLYVVTGIAHWITGIKVLTLMPKLAPIFGGLSVLIFYFVVYELLGDRKKALLASLFLAVLPFHVYQTSHAAPLTIGHFFMMLSLYFFLKFRKDTRYAIPLFSSTVLLTMSHHLTTYFYLVSLIFIVFVENASRKKWTPTVKTDTLVILATSGIAFSYWILVAKPVYEGFMKYGLQLGPIEIGSSFTIVLFYVLFFALFGIVWLKRKCNFFRDAKKPTRKSCLVKFSLSLIICVSAMCVFAVVKLPWTNFRFTPMSIVYSLPLLLMVGFGVAGFRYTRFLKNGGFIRGWMLALLLSFFYALVTKSGAIPPDRHLEYIMVPLSIIAVFGIQGIFSNLHPEKLAQWRKTIIRTPSSYQSLRKLRIIQRHQLVYVAVIFILVAANAASVYPAFDTLNAAYEEITNEDMAAIDWMQKNVDTNASVIASDHRLARMTEAVGFNTTLDKAYAIWITENLTEYIDELEGFGKNYSRITHVLIDDIMKERVVHVGDGEIYYMTNASYEKFSSEPFEFLYRNETRNQDGVVVHWAEVYNVNWTYLQKYSTTS